MKAGLITLGVLVLLGACGALFGDDSSDKASPASTATASASVSASPAPPASSEPSPVPSGGDVTEQFLATQWGQQFQGVVMDVDQEFTEDGTTMRLEADTNLVAPQDAAQAAEVCEALKSAFRDDWGKLFYVRVNEMNGVVFLTNQGGCSAT